LVTILAFLVHGWSTEQTGFIARAWHEASLLHGMLLAAAGGYVDAFTFVGKGRVFATAMTGNVMIMGTLIAGNEWKQAWSRISAIAAFIAAVWCPRFSNLAPLPRRPKRKSLSLSFSFFSGAADLRCEGAAALTVV
jgi:uncharacterized membrane protein YoaK (UPF0700 family)